MWDIELKDVTKTYNPGLFKRKVRAVTDLSLNIARGEVFGLIGPNGAGKSSTIRMILGMSRPDRGTIQFRGQPLSVVDFRNEIGYLPENPYLYDHLNLNELLRFCGQVSGLSPGETRERSNYLSCKLGLEGAARRPLRTYSKGMLQRAGICFALLHNPSVAILDEPMSGLDPIGRRMVFDLVSDLRQAGKTVFFCSHILSDVERLCDRIGLMVGGRLVRVITREELLAAPGNRVLLSIPPLSSGQREQLAQLTAAISLTRDGEVVEVEASRLSEVYLALEGMAIRPEGIRTTQVSLEELFMTAVEDGSNHE